VVGSNLILNDINTELFVVNILSEVVYLLILLIYLVIERELQNLLTCVAMTTQQAVDRLRSSGVSLKGVAEVIINVSYITAVTNIP